MAAVQIVGVGLLLWLAADSKAHQKLHEVCEVGAIHCAGKPAGDDQGHQPHDEDQCAVTLFQQGNLDWSPMPVAVPIASLTDQNLELALPASASALPAAGRLPFSCGPPVT